MKYKLYVFLGIVALTLVAAGLTETSLIIGRNGQIADDVLHRPSTTAAPVTGRPRATPAPTELPASPSPTPTATPAPTPTAQAPGAATATTNSFVRLRAAATTSSAVVTELQAGTTVTLGDYRDASWQQVSVNGQSGYVFRAYLSY